MFLEQFPVEGRLGESMESGWIEVICGSMFSGKTEELIRRLRRVEFTRQQMLLFKPIVDNRYHDDEVVSHIGSSLTAISIHHSSELLKHWNGERIIAIDEAQFFDDGLIEVCNELALKGVRLIVAGLDMDFKGQSFGPMAGLLCCAEYVTKVHAICVSCGNLAQYSHRTAKVEERVLIGATDTYEPLCRSCYNKAHL